MAKMPRDIGKAESINNKVKRAHNRTDSVLREYQAESMMGQDNREVKQMFESTKDTLKRKGLPRAEKAEKDFKFLKHTTGKVPM